MLVDSEGVSLCNSNEKSLAAKNSSETEYDSSDSMELIKGINNIIVDQAEQEQSREEGPMKTTDLKLVVVDWEGTP